MSIINNRGYLYLPHSTKYDFIFIKENNTSVFKLPSDNKQSGFSLIETMIALAIVSILITTAIPSFSSIINQTRLSTTSYKLQHSLALARQSAISSGNKVHLCALDPNDPNKCEESRKFNSNWSQGWMVFADVNDNNELDSHDNILSINNTPHTINIVFNQRGRLRFFPDGSARSAGFYICNKKSEENRHIKLLYSGRARTTKISKNSQLITCLSAN